MQKGRSRQMGGVDVAASELITWRFGSLWHSTHSHGLKSQPWNEPVLSMEFKVLSVRWEN